MNVYSTPFVPTGINTHNIIIMMLHTIRTELNNCSRSQSFFIEDIRKKVLNNGSNIENLNKSVDELKKENEKLSKCLGIYMQSLHSVLLKLSDEINELREEVYNKTIYLQQILEELGRT